MHSRSSKGLAEVQNQRLIECIISGRMYKLRAILEDSESDMNFNYVDENQMTPLMVACSLDNERTKTREYTIRMLLKRGANPNIVDACGTTVLANACKQNNIEVVKILLKRAFLDIDFNVKDRFGDTCLMHAVRTNSTELVQLVVNIMRRLSVDIDVKNNSDITPYLEAKRLGFNDVANILTKDGKASQTIMICPLIFDEHAEDAYNKANTVQAFNSNSRKSFGSKSSHQNLATSRVRNRNRQVKSAQEKRRNFDGTRKRVDEVKDLDTRLQRRKSDSELSTPDSFASIHDREEKPKNNKSKKEKEKATQVPSLLPMKRSDSKLRSTRSKDIEAKEGSNSNQKEAALSAPNSPVPKICMENSSVGVNLSTESVRSQNEASVTSTENHENSKPANGKLGTPEQIGQVVQTGKVIQTEQPPEADKNTNKSKNAWLRCLQKRAPMWRRRIHSHENKAVVESENGIENYQNDKIANIHKTLMSQNGTLQMIHMDKPSPPLAPRRCSSTLSVYFNGHQNLQKSRPGSAVTIDENPAIFTESSQGNPIAQDAVGPSITYEEVFELCPEMKDDSKRKWYSDIRWMLALKAHQNSQTFLPAQPHRFHHDISESEFRNESEGSRTSQRASVYDLKRPMIKKRHTTISPTSFKVYDVT